MATATNAPTTRERLVNAAIEVFVADGYERARVQDIARAAGLTTGAIYANYRGKADLLFEAIGERADVEMDALLQDASGHPARELLEVLGDRLVAPRHNPPLLLDAIAASRRDPSLAHLLHDRLDAREQLVADLVEEGKRDGSVDGGLDTHAFARFCVMLAFGALVTRSLRLDPPDPGEWHSLITRLLDACTPTSEAR